jgi:hypothetical protein
MVITWAWFLEFTTFLGSWNQILMGSRPTFLAILLPIKWVACWSVCVLPWLLILALRQQAKHFCHKPSRTDRRAFEIPTLQSCPIMVKQSFLGEQKLYNLNPTWQRNIGQIWNEGKTIKNNTLCPITVVSHSTSIWSSLTQAIDIAICGRNNQRSNE